MSWRALCLIFSAFLGSAACASHEDDVCESMGNCAQGGSSDWVATCQDEAKALRKEATAAGCGTQFDDYFSCADSNFTCEGVTPGFPGCEAKHAALDQCLSTATANTSCAALQSREEGCHRSDAGTGDADGGLSPACTAARDCQAHCYLTEVSDVCAPRVDELSNFATCTASCPP
jgi:hypothetical protein